MYEITFFNSCRIELELSTNHSSIDKNVETIRSNTVIRVRTPTHLLVCVSFNCYLSFRPSKKYGIETYTK